MDDYRFQQQLHILKERVSELSSKPSPALRTSDPFTSQLHELKAHLASMQERFARYQDSMPQTRLTTGTEALPAGGEDSFEAQSRLGLPSGPLFWQLFNSLRTDVQSLDSRVATLESTVSDLEDKVDSMDPYRFTPPESPSEFEGTSICNNFHDTQKVPSNFVQELASDSVFPHSQPRKTGWTCSADGSYFHLPEPERASPEPRQTFQDENDTRSNKASQGSVYDGMLDHAGLETHAMGNDQPPILAFGDGNDSTGTERNGLLKYPASSEWDTYGRSTKNGEHTHSRQSQKYLDGLFQRPHYPTQWGFVDESQKRSDDYNNNDDQGRASAQENEWRMYNGSAPGQPTEHGMFRLGDDKPGQWRTKAVGGLAFRDREIARMDEQLRIAHERLRVSEEAVSQKDAKLSQMQLERDDARDIIHDREKKYSELEDRLAAQDAEIGDLHSRIEQSNGNLRNWEESWSQLHDCYRHTSAKLKACERILREEQERKTSTINRLIHDHEGEIKRLQSFCEQKDGIAYKQKQIISRGGKLLEQRDDEIESLHRRLRAREDDKEHAIRTASRTARLLDEKNAELLQLKEMLQTENSKQNSSVAFDEDAHSSSSRSVNVGTAERGTTVYAVEGGSHANQNYQPPIYEPPNAEQRPPYLWENAIPEYEQQDFGNSGWQRSPSSGKRRGRVSRRHKARRFELRDDWRPPTPFNEGSGETAEPQTSVERGTPQGSQPEDVTLRPPLPAPPVRTRRMASEANLRMAPPSDNAIPAHKRLSKHQSMLELRGSRMQAYVETDVESTGGFGGEV